MPIRLNIALVEDLDRAQQLFTWLINLFDRMEVTMTARSGQEILEKLKTADPFPDLILVNVVLDGMSGLETVKAIMQQHSRPRIAVFSMCAEDDRRVRDMLDAGCVAFIQKSGDPREIREGILKAVRLLPKRAAVVAAAVAAGPAASIAGVAASTAGVAAVAAAVQSRAAGSLPGSSAKPGTSCNQNS